MAYGPVLGPVAPATDPFGRGVDVAERQHERSRLAEQAVDAQDRNDTATYNAAMDRITTINREIGQPLGVPVGPSPVSAPHVARPDAGWDKLGIVRPSERRIFERHIGMAPDAFIRDYFGGEARDHKTGKIIRYEPFALNYRGTWGADEDDGPELNFSGYIRDRDTGAMLGDLDRDIYPDRGESHHGFFRINEAHQGKGIGREIINNHIDSYGRFNSPIHKVTLLAALEGGGYNWPKRGWLPDDSNHNLYGLSYKLWRRLEAIKGRSDATPDQLRDVARVLTAHRRSSNPDEIEPEVTHALIDHFSKPQHVISVREGGTTVKQTLAKHMLRGRSFHATLNLRDPYQMERFDETR